MRRMLLGLVIVGALAGVSEPAQAQLRFGAGAAWGSDTDFGLSGRLLLGLGAQVAERPLHGQVSLDWFLDPCDPGDCTYFEITPAAFIPFAGTEANPYAGAGLSIAHISFDTESPGLDDSNTEIGLALLGGIMFPIGGVTGQAEGRLTIGDADQLVLTFSFLFGSRQ